MNVGVEEKREAAALISSSGGSNLHEVLMNNTRLIPLSALMFLACAGETIEFHREETLVVDPEEGAPGEESHSASGGAPAGAGGGYPVDQYAGLNPGLGGMLLRGWFEKDTPITGPLADRQADLRKYCESSVGGFSLNEYDAAAGIAGSVCAVPCWQRVDDCIGMWGTGTECRSREEGHYCVLPCTSNFECPWGMYCGTTTAGTVCLFPDVPAAPERPACDEP